MDTGLPYAGFGDSRIDATDRAELFSLLLSAHCKPTNEYCDQSQNEDKSRDEPIIDPFRNAMNTT
jgi:hypothetical protein